MPYWYVYQGGQAVESIYAKDRRTAEKEFNQSKREGTLPTNVELGAIKRYRPAREAYELRKGMKVKLTIR